MSNELLSTAALSENEDRFERGLKVLFDMSSEKMDLVTNRLAEVAPDFARLVIEYAFGAIFARDVLDMRTRELIAVSVLTARGDSITPLRAHIASALKFGISQAEVVESMMQVSIYSGFPVVINALTACHDLLTMAEDPNCIACPDPVQSTEVGHS
jgi:4-carboxymuconolactone decarboxylase